MRERITQVLLGAAVILLAVLFFRAAPLVPAAQAADGANVPDVVRARMFELVDDKGQLRANLKIEDSNEVVFRLKDAKGTIRVKLGASEDGSGLLLINDETEPAVQLLAKKSVSTVTLSEKGKEKRVIKPE